LPLSTKSKMPLLVKSPPKPAARRQRCNKWKVGYGDGLVAACCKAGLLATGYKVQDALAAQSPQQYRQHTEVQQGAGAGGGERGGE
jgi:hypothetical protein